MTAICFVCNLPIMSHQVGLVWQGGNGWDEMIREQVSKRKLVFVSEKNYSKYGFFYIARRIND